LTSQLAELKQQDRRGILLACGPATLAPLAGVPGLIDAYAVVIHPAVIAAGPGMFEHLTTDLALELTAAKVFDGGAVILHYRVI
jgi:riboflavin biosynthesis pyrimidine reductase